MKSMALLLVVVLAALTQGCADDPVSAGPHGSYNARVTGGVSRSLSGEARVVFGSGGYGGPTATLVLGAERASDRVALVTAGTARPGVGDYEITATTEPATGEWIGGYLISANGETVGSFIAETGVVRITQSDGKRVAGLFALDAAGYLSGSGPDPVQIVIEGTFETTW